MKRKGYTLVEMVVALIVVGILSGLAIIIISSAMRGIQLNTAAERLAADLRYAQNMASGTARWYGVSFEANPANFYTLYTTTGTIDATIDNPAKAGSNFVINTNTDFGVTISGVSVDGGGKKVEFHPFGTPYRDKTSSVITTEAVITLMKSSSTRTVRITPETGRIYIQ